MCAVTSLPVFLGMWTIQVKYCLSCSSTCGSLCPAQSYAYHVLFLLRYTWVICHYSGLNSKFPWLKIRSYVPVECCHWESVETICVWLGSVQIYWGSSPNSSSLQLPSIGLSSISSAAVFAVCVKYLNEWGLLQNANPFVTTVLSGW